MNILIITPFYKQDRNIASVRWTNIAQRLAKKHNIIIATQPLDNDMDMTFTKKEEDGILVARLNQKTAYEKLAVKYFHGATGDDWQTTDKTNAQEVLQQKESLQRKVKNAVLYASMQAKAKAYARQVCRDVIPKGVKIDVVISSACPFIEMLFGYEVKKRLGCKWISDFRDLPFVSEDHDDAYRMKRLMIRELKTADAVVTIAPMGKEFLVDHEIADPKKIQVITNGFSQSDAVETESCRDTTLHLVHTGSLYGGSRKPDLLFRAMKEIKIEHPECDILLEVAGGNNTSLREKAKAYGIEDQLMDHGFLPRTEAIMLQDKADCLVVITEYRPGSLAAKLFEYSLCRKPIICITCGVGKNSDETRYILQCNLGIAVEESKGDSDYFTLKSFLLEQASKKKTGFPLTFAPDESEISKYDLDIIAKKMEDLCVQMTGNE